MSLTRYGFVLFDIGQEFSVGLAPNLKCCERANRQPGHRIPQDLMCTELLGAFNNVAPRAAASPREQIGWRTPPRGRAVSGSPSSVGHSYL